MYAKFGNTDLKTSKVVFGCMGSAGAFGTQDKKDSISAIRTAFDVGINFFDTAEEYGNGYSEQLLAKALGNKRKEISIISKVSSSHMKKDEITEACDRSLRNLKTDYIDLYLLHWPVDTVPVEERLEALYKLKQQGKIRYYGVSNFGSRNLDEILSIDSAVTANEVVYNLLFRAVEYEVLPKCIENNVPILCYSSVMQGLLAGKYRDINEFPENRARTKMFNPEIHKLCRHHEPGAEEEGNRALTKIWEIVKTSGLSMEELAVGWLKSRPGIGGVIIGTRNSIQSKNLRKLIDINLESHTVSSLSDATDDLKESLGPNIDMWDYRSR